MRESQAYREGIEAVTRLGVGRLFLHAQDAADDCGPYHDEDEHAAFIAGFVDTFQKRWPNGVRVDHNNRITED